MKLSAGVEWGLHCCVVLSQSPAPVPAGRLAEYHGVSASYLAKHLQALTRSGITTSTQGQIGGGYSLTRPAKDITVLDVILAIDGDEPAFRCTEIRQQGPQAAPASECTTRCSVAKAMDRAEAAWREALADTSIADIAADVEVVTGGRAFTGLRGWLSGVL